MASLTLGATTYAITPFKLRELRRAAPYIDRLTARGGRLDTVAAMTDAAADMVGVIAVGIVDATPEALLAEIALTDLDGLRATFEAVLAEAGLQRPTPQAGDTSPGEASAGTVADP